MAPLETTTNAVALRAATVAASRSKMPPSPASDRDPILTTTRRARATRARSSAIGLRDQLVEGGVEPLRHAGGHAGGEPDQAVDERGEGVSLVVDGGRLDGARGRDGQRAHDRPVDGAAHAPGLGEVDANGAL